MCRGLVLALLHSLVLLVLGFCGSVATMQQVFMCFLSVRQMQGSV